MTVCFLVLVLGTASPQSPAAAASPSAPPVARPGFIEQGAQAAEATLATARDTYGLADYRAALEILGRLKSARVAPEDSVEVDKYRAFCLLALGRNAEARQVFSELLAAHPDFRIEEGEVSRRVFEVFREVRRQSLPGALARAFQRGRQAYELRLTQDAEREFERVLELSADPDMPRDAPLAADARELARGYLDLLIARRPPVRSRPLGGFSPLPSAGQIVFSDADPEVVPPEPLAQQFPPWPSYLAKVRTQGVLELSIDEEGRVESASVRPSIHPVYDTLLLEQTKQWRYKPALRGTTPVKYRKRIRVNIAQPPEGS